MAGSDFGKILHISTWGESHGPALGAVLDGFPAGMDLSAADIQPYLDRRKPGRSEAATQRKEEDRVEILSGVFEGKTTGAPISMLIRNTSQRSGDYGDLADCFRPGHADYTFFRKYGIRDYRGGGRSSGRETAARVACGAVAAKLLARMGVDVCAYARAIGPIEIDPARFDRSLIATAPTAMPDAEAGRRAMDYLQACRQDRDSAGGVVECVVRGVPAGIGDPVFDKLDARLAQALMSVGAVKAVEIGDGVEAARAKGSENNDPFCPARGREGAGEGMLPAPADKAGKEGPSPLPPDVGLAAGRGGRPPRICKSSNHAGGILGGISDGSPIIVRAHIKPTPSIFREQDTVDIHGNPRRLLIKGRHDPVIVPRAVVVIECMCALAILDAMLVNMSARADRVVRFYTAFS